MRAKVVKKGSHPERYGHVGTVVRVAIMIADHGLMLELEEAL